MNVNVTRGDALSDARITVSLSNSVGTAVTGTVRFLVDGDATPSDLTLAGDTVTWEGPVGTGNGRVVVSYLGDANNDPLSATVSASAGDVVTEVSAPRVVQIDLGAPWSVTASVLYPKYPTAEPRGTVRLVVTDAEGGERATDPVPLTSGAAILAGPRLGIGLFSYVLEYLPDAPGFATAVTQPARFTVDPAPVTITAPAPAGTVVGQDWVLPVSVQASTDPTLPVTGTVSVSVGQTLLTSGPLVAGAAQLTVPGSAGLPAGSHDLTVDYSGDASTKAGSLVTTVTVVSPPVTPPVTPPTLPSVPQVPSVAVPVTSLDPALADAISAPRTTVAGQPITVTVGTQHAGEFVQLWLHSTPTALGSWTRVDAAGRVSALVPASVPVGAHTLVVQDRVGAVLGWTSLQVTAALGLPAAPVVPVEPVPTVQPAGTPATVRPATTSTLAATGTETGVLPLAALALVLAGAATTALAARRRAGSRG